MYEGKYAPRPWKAHHARKKQTTDPIRIAEAPIEWYANRTNPETAVAPNAPFRRYLRFSPAPRPSTSQLPAASGFDRFAFHSIGASAILSGSVVCFFRAW